MSVAAGVWSSVAIEPLHAQNKPSGQVQDEFRGKTTQDYNRRLEQLQQTLGGDAEPKASDYRIGPEDLLEITVLEAPDLNRTVRVAARGEISLPLLGGVKTVGLTPRQLEIVIEELLRRSYMKDPHVGVFVREVQSHPISIVGAVKKPGVFQVRGAKSLLEVLSLAEGLADDAGDTVIVMRGAGLNGAPGQNHEQSPGAAPGSASRPATETGVISSAPTDSTSEETLEVNLKDLLESGNSRYNLAVNPGDIVKVTRAGIVYVVGEVRKPGGFLLKNNENISVLQAIALGEGLTHTAAKSHARIIRTDEHTGKRTETAINLESVLAGKAPDPVLQPKDIVFVPNSTARSAWTRGLELALQTASGVVIWRR